MPRDAPRPYARGAGRHLTCSIVSTPAYDDADPLLAKLSLPKLPGPLVPRVRLLDRLCEGTSGPVTLVCGPSGSGKTTLVASWVAHDLPTGKVAWLTLDRTDDDPDTFWCEVAEALRRHGTDVAYAERGSRDDAGRPVLKKVATALARGHQPVVLVLDRFDAVTDETILRDLERLLTEVTPQLRLVLVTRHRTAGEAGRRLLAGGVTEIDAADLALGPDEAVALLAQHDVALPRHTLDALPDHLRTSPAGLELCVFALRAGADLPGPVRPAPRSAPPPPARRERAPRRGRGRPAGRRGGELITAPHEVGDLGTILGVWAHPDDEAYLSGGLMALARDAGARVVCVTATRGEQGTPDPVTWPPHRLADERTRELSRCLAVLAVEEHHWLGYADGGCAAAPATPAVDRLSALFDEVRPDTVVTFGPDGITGHPDHQTVSAWTTAAFEQAAPTHARLLYAAVGQSRADRWSELEERLDVYLPGYPVTTPDHHLAVDLDLDAEVVARKVRALLAQETQTRALVDLLGLDRYTAWVAGESFVEADRTGAPRTAGRQGG